MRPTVKILSLLVPLLFCPVLVADDPVAPRIVGSPNQAAADSNVRVRAGVPPWVALSVKDSPEGATQTWSGPIGESKVGFYLKDGLVGVSTAVPGTYDFRCILQVPKEGLDEIKVLDTQVIVEGTGPVPPPPPPVKDFATLLTARVKSSPAQAELNRVAGAYDNVADQIKGNLLANKEAVEAMTKALTSFVSPEAWPAIQAELVTPHLATLTLAVPEDYEPVWRQIAAAIKAGLTDTPPPPDVDPLPVTSLHVLIVEEMDDRSTLPASQVDIFSSPDMRKWFVENNVQWRIFDEDTDMSQAEQKWQDAMSRPRESTPWIMISNGQTGYEGPLPKTEADTIKMMEKYK